MHWSEEPLDAAIWFRRIEMIRNRELPRTENALRHALHLLQLTPFEFRPRECPAIDEDIFEGLLAEGHFEEAARLLVTAPTLSVTANCEGGSAKAGIKCRVLDRTIHGEGPTVADAILQAWSECLLMLRAEYGESWLKAAEMQ